MNELLTVPIPDILPILIRELCFILIQILITGEKNKYQYKRIIVLIPEAGSFVFVYRISNTRPKIEVCECLNVELYLIFIFVYV